MFTDAKIFTVILLMNPSLGIPTPIGTLVVASTRTKAALPVHKTKRGQRRQPRKPLWRIRGDREFPFLWTDEDVLTSGSIFNQRNQPYLLTRGGFFRRV